MDKKKLGLVSYMTEHREIRSGHTRVLPPGWTEERDDGIRVENLISCTPGVGAIPEIDDLVVCVPALSEGAALGPGRIVSIHAGEGSCIVQHFEGGVRQEYSIGRFQEFHLSSYEELPERRYYFKLSTSIAMP